jgi:hypothetical protein
MPASERLRGVAARGIGVMRWLERMAATASALKGFEEFTSWGDGCRSNLLQLDDEPRGF